MNALPLHFFLRFAQSKKSCGESPCRVGVTHFRKETRRHRFCADGFFDRSHGVLRRPTVRAGGRPTTGRHAVQIRTNSGTSARALIYDGTMYSGRRCNTSRRFAGSTLPPEVRVSHCIRSRCPHRMRHDTRGSHFESLGVVDRTGSPESTMPPWFELTNFIERGGSTAHRRENLLFAMRPRNQFLLYWPRTRVYHTPPRSLNSRSFLLALHPFTHSPMCFLPATRTPPPPLSSHNYSTT